MLNVNYKGSYWKNEYCYYRVTVRNILVLWSDIKKILFPFHLILYIGPIFLTKNHQRVVLIKGYFQSGFKVFNFYDFCKKQNMGNLPHYKPLIVVHDEYILGKNKVNLHQQSSFHQHCHSHHNSWGLKTM